MRQVQNPYDRLVVAPIERAFVDVYRLRQNGILKGWEVIDEWPMIKRKGIAKVFSDEYRCKSDVKQLIWFFTSGDVCALARVVGNYDSKEEFMRRCDELTLYEVDAYETRNAEVEIDD